MRDFSRAAVHKAAAAVICVHVCVCFLVVLMLHCYSLAPEYSQTGDNITSLI